MSQLQAVIFGSIGSIVETSDIQRQAFNAAFTAAGLDWNWDAKTYRDLLQINGGQNRIQAYRDADPQRQGVTDTTIAEMHKSKTEYYAAMLENIPLHPRPGVAELVEACCQEGVHTAFCTSTARDNVNGIGAALAGLLPFDRFQTIVTIDQITHPKPAPDAYIYCLQQLGLTADQVVAIEDTPVSMAAAQAAGITTIATPGATTTSQDFSAADLTVSDLTGMTVDRLSALLQNQWHLATYFSQ
jgi:HAD superfamily hydrolase (TIGR01509 family)